MIDTNLSVALTDDCNLRRTPCDNDGRERLARCRRQPQPLVRRVLGFRPLPLSGLGRAPISYFAISTIERLSYNIFTRHLRWMNEPDPKQCERALAIEYWISTLIVVGAFIVGLGKALSYLLRS